MVLSADIYEKVQGELEAAGMETECLGGGRILHDKAQRTIQVFGYSQVSVVILLFSFFVLFCLDFVFDFIFLSTALGVKLLTIIYYYSSENRFLRLMMLAYRLCIYLFSRSD